MTDILNHITLLAPSEFVVPFGNSVWFKGFPLITSISFSTMRHQRGWGGDGDGGALLDGGLRLTPE